MIGLSTKCLLLLFSLQIIGCAQPQQITSVLSPKIARNVVIKDDPSLRIVAVDLVSVLGQLPGFHPWSMTTQVSPSRNSYGKAIVDALTDAGYGVQRVSADQGLNHVKYKNSSTVDSTGSLYAFEIEVRGVRIARNYEQTNNRWIPSSAFRIYGVKPSRVVVYNDLHSDRLETTEFTSGVAFYNANGDIVESRESLVGVANGVGTAGDAGSSSLVQRALSLSQASTFTRQRAMVGDDKKSYRAIAEVVLRFPSNNPSELGGNNKQAIAEMLQRAGNESYRFIIRGCSHGKSLLWDGTESTSLERQQRVNKELLVSGVRPDAIREMGCFKKDTDSELPKQAVSLVLERSTNPL